MHAFLEFRREILEQLGVNIYRHEVLADISFPKHNSPEKHVLVFSSWFLAVEIVICLAVFNHSQFKFAKLEDFPQLGKHFIQRTHWRVIVIDSGLILLALRTRDIETSLSGEK